MEKKRTNNPFRREDGNQQEKSKKESEWGKVKFNPVARNVVTEQATPWSHFKNDLIKQQQSAEHDSKMNNNANAQEIIRKREETYRRNLITSKRNVPTQWEDFSDEIDTASSSLKQAKDKKKGKFQQLESNIKNFNSIKKEDFDAKLLTPAQNNFLKKIITKNTKTQKKISLKDAVKEMKFKGVVKNKLSQEGIKKMPKKKTKK